MSRTTTRFDFRQRVAYDPEAKHLFHSHAQRQLKALAAALGLAADQYNLRSNEAGPAVSGEITLHADHLYVQVSQPATGADTGILFRSCSGRCDYIGGVNNFASLDPGLRRGRFCCTGRPNSPAASGWRALRSGVAPGVRRSALPTSRPTNPGNRRRP
jgi:hypothetical protein